MRLFLAANFFRGSVHFDRATRAAFQAGAFKEGLSAFFIFEDIEHRDSPVLGAFLAHKFRVNGILAGYRSI